MSDNPTEKNGLDLQSKKSETKKGLGRSLPGLGSRASKIKADSTNSDLDLVTVEKQIKELTSAVKILADNQKKVVAKLESLPASGGSGSGGSAPMIKAIESLRKGLANNIVENHKAELAETKEVILTEIAKSSKNQGDNSKNQKAIIAEISKHLGSLDSFDVARANDLIELKKSLEKSSEDVFKATAKKIQEIENLISKQSESKGSLSVKHLDSLGKSLLSEIKKNNENDIKPILTRLESSADTVERHAIQKEDLEKLGAALISRLGSANQKDDLDKLSKQVHKFQEDVNNDLSKLGNERLKSLASSLVKKISEQERESKAETLASIKKIIEESSSNSSLNRTDLEGLGKSIVSTVQKISQTSSKSLEDKITNTIGKVDSGLKKEDLQAFGKVLLSSFKQEEQRLHESLVSELNSKIKEQRGASKTDLQNLGASLTKAISEQKSSGLNAETLQRGLRSLSEAISKSTKAHIESIAAGVTKDEVEVLLEGANAKQLNKEALSQFGKVLTQSFSKQLKEATGTSLTLADLRQVETSIQTSLKNKGSVSKEDLTNLGQSIVKSLGQVIHNAPPQSLSSESVDQLRKSISEDSRSRFNKLEKSVADSVSVKQLTDLQKLLGESIVKALKPVEPAATKRDIEALTRQVPDQVHEVLDQSADQQKKNLEVAVKTTLVNTEKILNRASGTILDSLKSQLGKNEESVAELANMILSGVEDRLSVLEDTTTASIRQVGNVAKVERALDALSTKIGNDDIELSEAAIEQLSRNVASEIRKVAGVNRDDLLDLDNKLQRYLQSVSKTIIKETTKNDTETKLLEALKKQSDSIDNSFSKRTGSSIGTWLNTSLVLATGSIIIYLLTSGS